MVSIKALDTLTPADLWREDASGNSRGGEKQ
jgi:hypothetical protein